VVTNGAQRPIELIEEQLGSVRIQATASGEAEKMDSAQRMRHIPTLGYDDAQRWIAGRQDLPGGLPDPSSLASHSMVLQPALLDLVFENNVALCRELNQALKVRGDMQASVKSGFCRDHGRRTDRSRACRVETSSLHTMPRRNSQDETTALQQ